MKPRHAYFATLLVICFGIAAPTWADDLRSAMEADNARWLKDFNSRNTKSMSSMYTPDAMILAPGTAPVKGREAIVEFLDEMIKDGRLQGQTLEIVDVKQTGNQAYQISRYTLFAARDDSWPEKISGNTVRIFERQPDGKWLTKVHIFN